MFVSLLVAAKLNPLLKFHSCTKRYFPHHYTIFMQHKNESTQAYANVSLSINSFVLLLKVMEGEKHWTDKCYSSTTTWFWKTWGATSLSLSLFHANSVSVEPCPETSKTRSGRRVFRHLHLLLLQNIGRSYICQYMQIHCNTHFLNHYFFLVSKSPWRWGW